MVEPVPFGGNENADKYCVPHAVEDAQPENDRPEDRHGGPQLNLDVEHVLVLPIGLHLVLGTLRCLDWARARRQHEETHGKEGEACREKERWGWDRRHIDTSIDR